MQSFRFRDGLATLFFSTLGVLVASFIVFVIRLLFVLRRHHTAYEGTGAQESHKTRMTHEAASKPDSQRVVMDKASGKMPVPVPASDVEPAPLASSVPDLPFVAKSAPGKRALAIVSAIVLAALIAITFLFSVRYYSGVLPQASAASTKGGQSARPTQTTQLGLTRSAFERGIIYPQWSPNGYGVQDTAWQQNMGTMKTQTGARWIELPVLFSQATGSSTVVGLSPSTSSVQSFVEGIEKAHSLGYKVFFVPLMQDREKGGWSGSIAFTNGAQDQAWFDSYWHTLQPYIVAAANQHVEQMAIGTELQTLQQTVPGALWNQLIARIHGVFQGTLTYDMNWSSLDQPMPDWLKNPALTYIGVSDYIPLLDTPTRVDPAAMPALWQEKIKTKLDALAVELGKQVLITEIGYRDSADALYRTWEATSSARPDPQEQAGAYEAALSNVLPDTHIIGTFFWGWDNVGMFAIAGQPAAQVLLKWYTLPQA